MTKYEYIAKLEKLLADMPPQERRDALEYYAEYFDAAGPDHEAETAEKLGDPETVARQILEGAGLSGNAAEKAGAESSQPVPEAPAGENPADGPVTRTGLHGPGLLVLFVVILLLVALALALSAAATGFRGFGRDKEIPTTASEQVAAEEPAALATQTPAPAVQNTATPAPAADASAPAAASANASADTRAPSDWETTYPSTLTEVDLELSQMNLIVTVDDTVSAVTLRGTGVADSALQADQKELERENKLDARLSVNQVGDATLTLVLPAANMPRRLEFKLNGGSATLPDLTLDELEVDSRGATVTVGSINARKVDLQEEGDGTVSADTVTADELSLEAKRGSVAVTRATVSRQLDAEAENGTVTATLQGNAADYRLDAENKGGTLNVNGENITGEVKRQGTTTASIEAECQFGTIALGFTG